jgi:hypothetical protein
MSSQGAFLNFSFAERKSSDLKENPEDNESSNEKIVEMKAQGTLKGKAVSRHSTAINRALHTLL